MNTIDKRIERLKRKLAPQPRTKKQIWRAEQIDKVLINQNSCCAICEIQFDSYEKAIPDWNDPQQLNLRGLLCNMCYELIRCSRQEIKNLKYAIKYIELNGSKGLMNEMFNSNKDDWRK